MPQRVVSPVPGPPGEPHHLDPRSPLRVGRNDPAQGWSPVLLGALLWLLAPPTLRAQDPRTLSATATVLPAQPSREALRSALRLAGQEPRIRDSMPAPGSPLARVRLRRPESAGDTALVVSIEFLHN